jgi:hypothetical protein
VTACQGPRARPACENADDAENTAEEAAEEAAEDANEETAQDIEGEDGKNADDENATAADADEEADKAEDNENADEEANVWEVSSSSAHGGPASVAGPAADWGGVSSRLSPLRSRPRCRAWTARAWPSMVSR